MAIISIIIWIVVLYLAFGFLFAIVFVLKGVTKIDAGAHGASWGFRVIIIPGSAIFWPLLLKRWIKTSKGGNP